MSLAPTLEDIPIIDVDTHVSEPGDLWTTRISSKYRDMAPHLVRDPDGRDIWTVSDKRLASPGVFATAGWPEYAPSHPKTLAEADPATWNPVDRLVRMDEYGLYAQVLYPNILAFYLPTFLSMGNPDFVADCIRAYNDFLVEFASADPERLLPMMLLPVWDMERCLAEFERCRDAGHRGVVLASTFAKIGLPPLWDRYWDRLFGASQEAGMSINFHVGFSELTEDDMKARVGVAVNAAEHTRRSSVAMMGNAQAVADIITMGLCHRFPDLNFVSVESGAGWMPYLMESLDWHWMNFGAHHEHPEMELPSFYLKRQVYGSFWFEREIVKKAVEMLPDNIMFESDFPHMTSLSPGPASAAEAPRASVTKSLEGVSPEIARKVLYENAARLYGVGAHI